MAQKIACGGFEIGDGLELNGKVLSASGGGAGGMVVNATLNVDPETEEVSVTADKTVAEIVEAAKSGHVSANLMYEGSLLYSVGLIAAMSDMVCFGLFSWSADQEKFFYTLEGYNNNGVDEWTFRG